MQYNSKSGRGHTGRLAAILILAALFAASCSGKKEPAPSGETLAVIDSVASADGTMIHYETQGQNEPALVFIHGWSCDGTYWKNQVDYFKDKFRVVTIDLAGHGQSGASRADYTMEAFGQDVAAVINKLDLQRVILIGHSMGGPVIVEAARLLPGMVIVLVGADTFHDLDYRYPESDMAEWVETMRQDFAGSTMGFVRQMFPAQADSALVQRIANDMASGSPEVGISAMQNIAKYDLADRVKGLPVPIRCINSDRYPIDTLAGKTYAISYDVKFITGVGHFVMLEDPDSFNALLEATITEFLM